MSRLPKLVFFGNEQLATGVSTKAPVLNALIKAGYEIVALVISQGNAVSRNKRELEVVRVAKAHNIPVLRPKNVIEIKDELAKLMAEAGILVAFGQIVPQTIVDIFPKGIINIHPSLLPKLRGPTPVETAILEGLDKTGVSLMSLSAEMDAGPLYAQSEMSLHGNETKAELAGELLKIGAQMLIKDLPAILDGSMKPQPQTGQPSCSQKITKANGQLDSNQSAYELERQIRAFAGWPGSRTRIWGIDVIITGAHAVPGISSGASAIVALEEGALMLHSNDDYLCIDSLKPAGKKEMSAADFIRGYKKT